MSILEFGAGASTVLIANLIARNGLTTSFFSVEENPQWLELVDDWLRLAGVAHHVRLINAPIVENKQSGLSTWYDQDAIKSRLRSEEKFDCVVVDGPTAYSADAIGRRHPAGAWLRDRLAGSAAIFVDDIDRDGEWDMVKDWNQHYGWKFHQLSPSLGVFRFGQAHNIV